MNKPPFATRSKPSYLEKNLEEYGKRMFMLGIEFAHIQMTKGLSFEQTKIRALVFLSFKKKENKK